jgi:2-oxo-3-hexenedioate decarboxylase
MTNPQVSALAREMLDAYAAGQPITVPPSAREGGCDLDAGYAVEAELTRIRRASGRRTVGRKIGLANRAVWRALKMKTLVWANMYDDTVHHATRGEATLSLARMRAPRLEPEIVVKLKSPLPPGVDAAGALEAVEWYAFAFELVDCPFPDWKFQPGDFMASLGLHAALVVGEPRPVQREAIPQLVDQLGAFTVKLSKNGEVAQEGGGKNVLDNPALCLVEFASAVPAQAGAEALRPGELISTGSLTAAPPVAAGEHWSVAAQGLDVPPLSLRLTA